MRPGCKSFFILPVTRKSTAKMEGFFFYGGLGLETSHTWDRLGQLYGGTLQTALK